jgi:hypothetical protein
MRGPPTFARNFTLLLRGHRRESPALLARRSLASSCVYFIHGSLSRNGPSSPPRTTYGTCTGSAGGSSTGAGCGSSRGVSGASSGSSGSRGSRSWSCPDMSCDTPFTLLPTGSRSNYVPWFSQDFACFRPVFGQFEGHREPGVTSSRRVEAIPYTKTTHEPRGAASGKSGS